MMIRFTVKYGGLTQALFILTVLARTSRHDLASALCDKYAISPCIPCIALPFPLH